MWWGGYSAPSRFLVSLILTGGAPAAVWFATRETDAARITGIALLGLSALITISIASIDRGALLFNMRDGFSLLLLRMAPVVDLTRGLPSAFQTPPLILAFPAAVWLLAIACPPAIAVLLDRRTWGRAALVLIVGLAGRSPRCSHRAHLTLNQPVSVAREAGGLEVLRRWRRDRGQVALSPAAAAYRDDRTAAANSAGPYECQRAWARGSHPVPDAADGWCEVEGVTSPGGSGHIRCG
jgi:hypothetical protein